MHAALHLISYFLISPHRPTKVSRQYRVTRVCKTWKIIPFQRQLSITIIVIHIRNIDIYIYKFIYHFRVYSSMALSTLTSLCNHQHPSTKLPHRMNNFTSISATAISPIVFMFVHMFSDGSDPRRWSQVMTDLPKIIILKWF